MNTRANAASAADAELLRAGELAIDTDEKTPEQIIGEFFGEAHADADITCSIYEINPAKPREISYLFNFEFRPGLSSAKLFDDILGNYGAGWYELQAQGERGNMVTRRRFQVGSESARKKALASVVPKRSTETERAERESEPVTRSGLSPELAAILDNQNRLIEKLADAQSGARGGQYDSVRDLLELKKLFEQPSQPLAEIMGIVRDVLKLKEDLTDEPGDDSPLGAAVKMLAPSLSKVIEKLNEQQPVPAPAQQPQPQPSQPASSEAETMFNLDAMFSELHKLAESNTPADVAAEAVLVQLSAQPEWVENVVLGMIVDEGERVVGRLVGSYPKLLPFRDWLTKVCTHILDAIEAAAAEETGETDGEENTGKEPKPAEPSASSPQP